MSNSIHLRTLVLHFLRFYRSIDFTQKDEKYVFIICVTRYLLKKIETTLSNI